MHRAIPEITPLSTALVERLMSPDAFGHPVGELSCIETHISWVILTDQFAYKIKKPLVLDFLDFGDLDKRRYYCNEELRLNRRWAGDLYIGVVPITEDNGQARFGGSGPVIEYAVKMRRFDQLMQLDHQLETGSLTATDMRELGREIAEQHLRAPRVESELRARVLQMTKRQIHDNFPALEGWVNESQLSAVHEWTEQELAAVGSTLEHRCNSGFARICHGDLHLGNLVRLGDGIRAFDCIEFNEDLRHIDTVCDYAFLVMDLIAKGRDDLAAHFINRYLEHCGDYAGVVLLDLFVVYRCLVRAKVAAISAQERTLADARETDILEAERYCRIAFRQINKSAPILVIMSGLSGSGKTWVAERLMAAMPAIRLRSDIERKRLHGLAEGSSSHSEIGGGIYTDASNTDVYEHLLQTAKSILNARHNVILDAAFLRVADRQRALSLAASCDLAAVIIDVRAPDTLLRERLRSRAQESTDASEAGLDVLESQRSSREALTAEERQHTIVFENDGDGAIASLVSSLQQFVAEVRR